MGETYVGCTSNNYKKDPSALDHQFDGIPPNATEIALTNDGKLSGWKIQKQ